MPRYVSTRKYLIRNKSITKHRDDVLKALDKRVCTVLYVLLHSIYMFYINISEIYMKR